MSAAGHAAALAAAVTVHADSVASLHRMIASHDIAALRQVEDQCAELEARLTDAAEALERQADALRKAGRLLADISGRAWEARTELEDAA